MRTRLVGDGRIMLDGTIDATILSDQPPPQDPAAPPTLGTLSQDLNVVLQNGKPLRTMVIDEPGKGSAYLEIKADLLD